MNVSRRFFLGGTIAVIAAQTFKPSISMATNLPTIYGNHRDDDSAGFNALFSNEPVIFRKEQIALESHDGVVILGGNFKISKTIEITKRTKLKIESHFSVDATELPSDMALIFYHPDTDFDPSTMDGRIGLAMQEKRDVPLFQYDWKDPNFTKKVEHYGAVESYTTKAFKDLLDKEYAKRS